MPRYDKDGHDVTGDKMGPGGRRKNDERQSVQAYDFKEYNERESRKELEEQLRLCVEIEEREQVREKERIVEEIDNFFRFLDKAVKFFEENPELAVKMAVGVRTFGEKAAEGARVFKRNVTSLKAKLIPKKEVKGKQMENVICEVVQEEVLGAPEQILVVESIPENSGQFQSIVLSREEAVKEVFNALNHYIELTRSLDILSNANIIDMKSLGFEGVIAKLEEYIQQYPDLLNESNRCKIVEILVSDFDEIERKRVKEVLGIDCIGINRSNQAIM